jgi:biotin operon repressor
LSAQLKHLRVVTNRSHGEALKEEYQNWKRLQIARRTGFFPVWNSFKKYLQCDQLSGGALRLYMFLGLAAKNNTGESWHSVERMSEELGCSQRSVVQWAKELKDKGLIERQQLRTNGYAFTYLRPYPNEDGDIR